MSTKLVIYATVWCYGICRPRK